MAMKDEKGYYVYVNLSYIKRYGFEAAVMLHEIIGHAMNMPASKKLKEGDLTWFILSVSDLKFMFPYWSQTHARHVLQTLIDEKVIKEKPSKGGKQRYFAFVANKFLS